MKRLNLTLIFTAFLGFGCASSETEYESKAHHAAYAAEGFVYEKDYPKRPVSEIEFYFKHCSLGSRKPYPSRDEYECSNPF
ncbi:MAG: hypothetical protein AB7O96_14505 [Pseudobdellovibrionaceae bacterium]